MNVILFLITNHKPWRMLTMIGFFFTFIIAPIWSFSGYTPDKLLTTSPFLVVTWLLYIGMALFYAYRQPTKLRGSIDGVLLFGTPIITFFLQVGLIRHIEFGIALSALTAAVVYIGLSVKIWKSREAQLKLLAESFLVMGIIFATIAIPFALTGSQFIIATWAIEGAGIIWISLRFKRLYARFIGGTIQFLAVVFFVASMSTIGFGEKLFINAFSLSAFAITLSMFASSYWLRRKN